MRASNPASVPARLDTGGPELGDPQYLAPTPAPAPAVGEPPPPLPAVAYPAMGWPELAPYGGRVIVWLRGAGPLDARDYSAALLDDARNPSGPRFPLEIEGISADPARGIRVLRARLPAVVARGTYDLAIGEPRAAAAVVPHAVRVYGADHGGFRFALMADHQLWDPSWRIASAERNAGDYPHRGESAANRAITRQELAELALLDPDFVLDAGDLIFGLDIPAEYREMAALWRDLRSATFVVPGNHDGYADYRLDLDLERSAEAVLAAAGCRRELDPSAGARALSWARVAGFLRCVYGDVTPILFKHPAEDGLQFFRRTFGPTAFAFDHGPLHVIALNSYGGSPQRRHAFALYLDAFGLHLGAPAVDNYGGYVDDAELGWVAAEAARADAAGRTVVLLAHQDPRGNLGDPARRYAEDNPFPTDPLSLDGFEEWNYDGRWTSDPDHPRRESAADNSGTRLLRVIARHVACVLTGHVHGDAEDHLGAGAEVSPGVRLDHPVDFVRVTTAASGTRSPSDYWGYRLLGVDASGRVDTTDFDAAAGLRSVPAGNFWAEQTRDPGGRAAVRVTNGLPRPLSLLLRFTLPLSRRGYVVRDAADGAAWPVADVLPWADGRTATYLVPVKIAGIDGAFPGRAGGERVEQLVAEPVPDAAPAFAVTLSSDGCGLGGRRSLASGASLSAWAGQTCRIEVDARLPGNVPAVMVAQTEWSVRGPGNLHREERSPGLELPLGAAGTYQVCVTVLDVHGARAKAGATISAMLPPAPVAPQPVRPPCAGCACSQTGRNAGSGSGALLVFFLAGAAAVGKFWNRGMRVVRWRARGRRE